MLRFVYSGAESETSMSIFAVTTTTKTNTIFLNYWIIEHTTLLHVPLHLIYFSSELLQYKYISFKVCNRVQRNPSAFRMPLIYNRLSLLCHLEFNLSSRSQRRKDLQSSLAFLHPESCVILIVITVVTLRICASPVARILHAGDNGDC